MNICGYGECMCGGWADDFGWHPCDWHPCDDSHRNYVVEHQAADADLIQRWYFWSPEHRIVLSVDQRTGKDERLPDVSYYLTPEGAARRARDEDDVRRLLNLNPVMDPAPPRPTKPGPRGQRRRSFPIKSKASNT